MGERGVKFVKPEDLPAWEWKNSEAERLCSDNPSYKGEGNRKSRRRTGVLVRKALREEAKRAVRRARRDALGRQEELRLSGN